MSLDPSSVPFLRSCERCRQKKRKCSGDKPICRWCQDHHLQCKYRRTMRFKKHIQDTESLAELSTPVNLQQPTDSVSADALAQLLSVDMVPSQSAPLPQDLLQMANSFMNPFPNNSVVQGSGGGLLDNLGDLLASEGWQTGDTKDWIPVKQNESMNLLDDIFMFPTAEETGTPIPPMPVETTGLPDLPNSDTVCLDIGTDGIPNILKEYVKQIPGQPTASVIYQIMRETFKAPRMGMVSLNIELLWYSLHCGVLPRIVFYGNLACTLRCSVVSTLDIQSLVPPDIDESCYQLALAEVPHIKECQEIWGAIGLCMVARYECHSARYKEMAMHAGMALEVMRRVKYQGKHEYPWGKVKDKEEFGFQYMLVIYWKCFLWKLMSLLLIERGEDWQGLEKELGTLPDYSSKTFDLYTVDHIYDVSLMEMIPKDSWSGSRDLGDLRFRGPNDRQFMGIRPEGSPSFRRSPMSGYYMQRLMVIYSRLLVQKLKVRCKQQSLVDFLRDLTVFKEHMRSWRYTLPGELVLDQRMMAEYQDLIRSGSSATWQEIDLRASKLKDLIVLLMTYHMFLVRANRFALKLLLDEPLDRPPPDILTEAFAVRDLYDTKRDRSGLGHLNFFFEGCRIEAIRSANALCSLTQAANACKFNFYTLGSPIIFAVFELLVVSVGLLKNRDGEIKWRAKGRLSNVFNILRRLRHWAPALHMFVGGIRSLSEPSLCLVEPNGMGDMTETPGGGEMDNGNMYMLGALESESTGAREPRAEERVRRDETLAYRAAEPIPEFPNPFPPSHVISLIVGDLDLSLAQFLAPAYPVLLLKLIPT